MGKFDSTMKIAMRPEIVFEKGEGSWLYDSQGKKYLDFIQGWAVNTLGHCPDVITLALNQQASTLISSSPAFYNGPMLHCADQLIQHSVFDQVFFANTGAEANEGAIKLARKWGAVNKAGAYKIITFEGGFHGRTLTTMAASGKAAFAPMFEPKTPGFIKAPFNDLSAVESLIDDQTVAIMLEPIQGEAGVIPANKDFVAGLRKLADEHQLLLIFDEVQTGIGRTGTLFAYEGLAVEPDIMTLGKGLGGGVPISALLAKTSCCLFEPGEQGGTYNGNPLMTSVASAVLQALLKPGFLVDVNARSEQLWVMLSTLSEQFSMGKVRGKGLLLALDTGSYDAALIAQMCMEQGLILNAPQTHCLRFVPALNVSKDEVDEMIRILTAVLLTITGQ